VSRERPQSSRNGEGSRSLASASICSSDLVGVVSTPLRDGREDGASRSEFFLGFGGDQRRFTQLEPEPSNDPNAIGLDAATPIAKRHNLETARNCVKAHLRWHHACKEQVMNSRARPSLEQSPASSPDGQHTTHISSETISRLKAECIEETSAPQPSSLSGMATSAAYELQLEPFTTVCELASGTTAMVYLAVDQRLDAVEKIVAVKHYQPRLMQQRDFAERFIEEMSVARAVDHPAVCKVLDFGQIGASFYTAMQFLQGEPLSNLMAASSQPNTAPSSPRLIAHSIASLADGLHALHSLTTAEGPVGAVHQDVTPDNLFVLYDGSLRVTNIGTGWIADLVGSKQGAVDKSYRAPEQLERGALDARVDVWALGVVFWELLAGKKLFRCATEREAIVEITARRIAAPSEHNPQVTAELDRIVLKALARNPNKRYASARELSADIERYLAESGGPVAKSTVAEWLMLLFPNGADRVRGLLELANASRPLPLPASAESVPPASGAYTHAAEAEAEVEHTTHIYPVRLEKGTLRSVQEVAMPGPRETISFKDIPSPVRRAKRAVKRPWHTRAAPFAAAFVVVLLCFITGYAAFSRSHTHGDATSAAAPARLPAAALQPAPTSAAARPLAPSPADNGVSPRPAPTPAPPTLTAPTSASASATQPKAALPSAALASTSHGPVKGADSKSASHNRTASTISTQPGAVFVTTPGGGDVYEGGRLLGHAPAEFELSPGWHTLLVKSGTDSRPVTVQVPAGAAIMVSVPTSKP
jgi:serine/threonine protein kinase